MYDGLRITYRSCKVSYEAAEAILAQLGESTKGNFTSLRVRGYTRITKDPQTFAG